ncbi:hypothetical protein ACWGE0_39260 [Lentzea sp. NPDC054927]
MSGWIQEGSLNLVAYYVSGLLDQEWDEHDASALHASVTVSDRSIGKWHGYTMRGLTVMIARDHELGQLAVYFSGDFNEVFAARLETLLDLC